MKDMEIAKKLVWPMVVCIVCLFISINGGMNGRSTALDWLALFGCYASLIYACVVWRGMAICTVLISGIGLAVQLIGKIDGDMVGLPLVYLVPATVILLWHFVKNR